MAKEETKKKEHPFVDISTRIREEIKKSANAKAVDALVAKKAEEEIAKRVEILDKGFALWGKTNKEIEKCREDVINHVETDSGEVIQQRSYSDAKYKEKLALKKRSADIEVALMLAFGDNQDYSKLNELIKNVKPDKE